MNTYHYTSQIILCLVTVATIPLALTKRPWRKPLRAVLAGCPIVYGGIYYLVTDDTSGLWAALMGAVALLAILLHPSQQTPGEEVQK